MCIRHYIHESENNPQISSRSAREALPDRFSPSIYQHNSWRKKKKRLPQIVRWVCCLLPTLRWPTRKGCASRCCMQQMDERSRCYCSAGETFKLLRLWRPWRIRRDVISTVIFTTAKDEISLLNSRQASFAAAVETWLLWHSESHSSDSKTNDNCFPLVSSNKGRVELCCEIKLYCNEEHICTY